MPHGRSLSAALAVALLVGLTGCGDDDRSAAERGREANQQSLAKAAGVPDAAGGALAENAVKIALPSVVSVSVSSGGVTRNGTGTLLIAGTVITDAKLVTTPSGVPAAGVTVREGNGEEHAGVVDGIDPLSGLAAVRVRDLTAVPVAKTVREAPMLGTPLAGLAFLSARRPAMRPGTVITTGRAVRADDTAEVGLFEVSAALGSQGFGGPVVDDQGRVVGITTKGLASMVPGTVVAVPVQSAQRIAQALADEGTVRRAYLGIETVGISPTRAKELNLTTSSGVLLRRIQSGSPASFSTLRPPTGTVEIGGREIPTGGDVIVAIDKYRVDEPEDLDGAIAEMQPGRRVKLKVIRGDTSVLIGATLGER